MQLHILKETPRLSSWHLLNKRILSETHEDCSKIKQQGASFRKTCLPPLSVASQSTAGKKVS